MNRGAAEQAECVWAARGKETLCGTCTLGLVCDSHVMGGRVRGVGRHVAALVVCVDCLVQAHQLQRAVLPEPHHGAQVGGPVQGRVGGDQLAPRIRVAVDDGRDLRQLGDQVQAVLQHRLPVPALVQARVVGRRKLAAGLQAQHRLRQLRHGVRARRQRAQQRLDVVGQGGAGAQLLCH
ncbi:hypothetical protein F751_4423 [Auxenochlorella protothecoides]|uniref:Uncharacterized protein n=1 Tax=Auxenochlorella protothecoides TaxID=3075 RepID=A0A087SCT7_AUXPR|nr:hypothetical protein F751_4423 [Auxenochlorella protothecoides]KFM23541.1 hypothetical protein F751_4423 [Auxenochlorella protothecoides]